MAKKEDRNASSSGKASKSSRTTERRVRSAAERCFHAESEARRKGKTTAFQENIYLRQQRFEIDKTWANLIVSEGLHPRWSTAPDIVWGRRVLEVAVLAAIDATEVRLNDVAKADWQQGTERAAKALGSLDSLLNWMNGQGLNWKKDGGRAIQNAVHSVTLQFDSAKPIAERFETTADRAQTLVDARVLLADMVRAYPNLRKMVTGQNPGQPEKSEFVFVLAEAWAYLLARPPALDKPFDTLVSAAWSDIGGLGYDSEDEPESFSHAMRTAVDRMKAIPLSFDWAPHWIDRPQQASALRDP